MPTRWKRLPFPIILTSVVVLSCMPREEPTSQTQNVAVTVAVAGEKSTYALLNSEESIEIYTCGTMPTDLNSLHLTREQILAKCRYWLNDEDPELKLIIPKDDLWQAVFDGLDEKYKQTIAWVKGKIRDGSYDPEVLESIDQRLEFLARDLEQKKFLLTASGDPEDEKLVRLVETAIAELKSYRKIIVDQLGDFGRKVTQVEQINQAIGRIIRDYLATDHFRGHFFDGRRINPPVPIRDGSGPYLKMEELVANTVSNMILTMDFQSRVGVRVSGPKNRVEIAGEDGEWIRLCAVSGRTDSGRDQRNQSARVLIKRLLGKWVDTDANLAWWAGPVTADDIKKYKPKTLVCRNNARTLDQCTLTRCTEDDQYLGLNLYHEDVLAVSR